MREDKFVIRSIELALAVALLAGCGKKAERAAAPPPQPAAPVERPATPPPAGETNGTQTSLTLAPPVKNVPTNTVPTNTASVVQTPLAPVDAAFEDSLQKIEEQERDAHFLDALQLCRTLKETCTNGDQQSTLNAIVLRLGQEKKEAVSLRVAAENLASDHSDYVRVAEDRLRDAGETGRIFLRKALRDEKDSVALVAAQVLSEQPDAQSLSVFAVQLLKRQSASLLEVLATDLRGAINDIPTNTLAAFHQAILSDTNFVRRETAGVLGVVFEERCHRTAETYNQLVGAPDGFKRLRAYIESALVSRDPEIADWACRRGGGFVGSLNAVMGRYYADPEFKNLALERLDTQINVDNRLFPFPDGRQDNISARWSGSIEIPKAGAYTFYALADTRCVVTVNTQMVVDCLGWAETNGTITLPAGRIPFNADYYQSGGNSRVMVMVSGTNIPKQVLGAGFFRVPPTKDPVLQLRPAILSLISTNWVDSRAGKATLSWSGDTGNIYLRAAVQNEADPVAARAAEMLAARRDARAPAVLIERIEKTPGSPIVPTLTAALCDLAMHLDPEQVQYLYQAMLHDADSAVFPDVFALCALLNRAYGDNKDRFNEAVHDPKGYDQLKLYVQRAMASSNNVVAINACEFGSPFAPLLAGLCGRYYAGAQFDALAVERLDSGIEVQNRAFPMPENRQDDISARWTGLLRIDTRGDYDFYSLSDNSASLWIDDRLVVGSVGWDEQKGTVTLAPGLHRLRTDFYQTAGNSRVQLSWSETNITKQVLAGSALLTPPWRNVLSLLPAAIDNLTSTNLPTVRAAKAAIAQAQGSGTVFLRNAIRYKPDPVAKVAAALLADRYDAPSAPLLIERLRKAPNSPIALDLLASLRDMAESIEPDLVPPLYEAVQNDHEFRMIPEASMLCLVLDRVCGGRKEAFNSLAKDPKAYEQLKAYVAQSGASSNDTAVMSVGGFGAPFVAPVGGLRGAYYVGQQLDDLALERVDSGVNIADHQFPLPNNQQEDISARWSGTLLINQPTNYTFQLYAQRQASLWIDGQNVLYGSDWSDRSCVLPLTNGAHRIRVDFQQDRGPSQIQLWWSATNITRQIIPGEVLRTPIWPRELAKLPSAIHSLASTNLVEIRSAKATLTQAGNAGRLFLRNAIRYQPDPVAKVAAAMLADLYDGPTAPLIIDRLRRAPASPIATDLLASLRDLAEYVPPDLVPTLVEATTNDHEFRMIPEASALCMVLDRICAGRPEEFNSIAKEPKAYEQLKTYVAQSGASSNEAVVMNVATFGAPFVAPVTGLRGRYYFGKQLDELVLEKVDGSVDVPDRQFPFPGGRQDDVSARWSGTLRTDRPTDYTFLLYAQTSAQLWIDGRNVVQEWNWEYRPCVLPLSNGAHRIRVDFQHDQSNSRIQLYWSATNLAQQVIPVDVLRTPLWPSELAKLPAAVTNLASTNPADVRSAKAALLQAGGAGRLYLRNAVRYKPDPIALQAAAILAQLCDADTADILLERIARQPGKPSAQEFLVDFRELARSASPRLIPPLYEAMNKDVGKSMVPDASALCIVLDRKCLRDKDQLNTLAGDPKAYEALQAYIGAALVSPDTGVVMRACEFGVPFAPSLSGLRGQYYEGRLLDALAVEKLDAQIAVPNRQFPLPNNRQDDIAARWTGLLNIGKSSTNYTFTLFGERTASLFIDGQYVVGSSNWQEQQKVLSLTNGPHAIQVVFQQDTGNSRVELYWSGPDFAKQLLAGAPLSTPAWKSELEKLRGLVAGLATTDPQQLATTTNAIRAYGPLAAVLLRQAVRYETNAVSPKAAGMLAALQDAGLAEAALDHLKSRPDSPVIHGLVSALGQSVTNLTQDQDVWLYQSVQQDAQFARPWHAGLLVRVLKDACAGNKDRFNALVKDPKGSDTLKAYSDAIQKQGPKAPAGWTNEFGIVTTP